MIFQKGIGNPAEFVATVTGVDTISLPKTAANTGMSVQLFGQSAENLVVNGDFRNGTTGWLTGSSTNSVTSGVLTNTGNGAAVEPNAYSSIGDKVVGNKYYLRANVTPKSALCTKIRIGSINMAQTIDSPIVNNPYLLSGVITASTTYGLIVAYHMYASTANANGAAIEVYNVMAINLTATYGAGNEPTKEQCDILFANYFEGTDNVLGTGRVRSVGKNNFKFNYLGLYTNQTKVNEGNIYTAICETYCKVDANIFIQREHLIAWTFGVYNYQKSILKAGKEDLIGTFKVIAFKTQHDAKEPYGYLLKSVINKRDIVVCNRYLLHQQYV